MKAQEQIKAVSLPKLLQVGKLSISLAKVGARRAWRKEEKG
jgi:hypothetical protein